MIFSGFLKKFKNDTSELTETGELIGKLGGAAEAISDALKDGGLNISDIIQAASCVLSNSDIQAASCVLSNSDILEDSVDDKSNDTADETETKDELDNFFEGCD